MTVPPARPADRSGDAVETTTTSATEAWRAERGRLLGIAYRMLGDFGEAEDVVSEVAIEAIRCEQGDADSVRSWPKWLTTVCVRRSIDRVRRLAASREDYPGPWMPEPISAEVLPDDAVANGELLSLALLHVSEQLRPEARAALILHRAFELTAPEIGVILDRSAAAVRQLISRAERRLRETGHLAETGVGPQDSVPVQSSARLQDNARLQAISRLGAAIADGDLERVVDLLAPGAVLWTDGGGKVRSALNPVFGAERVGRFFTGIRRKSHRLHPEVPFRLSEAQLVAETGLRLHHYGRSDLIAVEFRADGRIAEIRLISNPDKLARL